MKERIKMEKWKEKERRNRERSRGEGRGKREREWKQEMVSRCNSKYVQRIQIHFQHRKKLELKEYHIPPTFWFSPSAFGLFLSLFMFHYLPSSRFPRFAPNLDFSLSLCALRVPSVSFVRRSFETTTSLPSFSFFFFYTFVRRAIRILKLHQYILVARRVRVIRNQRTYNILFPRGFSRNLFSLFSSTIETHFKWTFRFSLDRTFFEHLWRRTYTIMHVSVRTVRERGREREKG